METIVSPTLLPNPDPDVQPLSDAEIKAFVDELDHNKDGFISYAEVEKQLDVVHEEIAPTPAVYNLHHDSADTEHRHAFLRSILGTSADRIPRDEFAGRVKGWAIPSMQQDTDEEEHEKEYMRKIGRWRRLRSWWSVHGPEVMFIALVVAMHLAFGIWQLVKYVTQPQWRAALGWGVVLAKTCAGLLYSTFFFLLLSMCRYFSTFLRRSYYMSRFINWDLSQTFHIRMSILALVLATLHAIGHLSGSFVFGSKPDRAAAVEALGIPTPKPYIAFVRSIPGFTGLTALGLFYLLALLSMPQVRKWNYELFQAGHLLMFPIIGLLMAHGSAALFQWPMLGYFLAFPTLLILVERITRVVVGFRDIPATIRVLDSQTVEIKATIPPARIWRYKPGQYVFLQVPAISRWQWHPFTVSVCTDRRLQLHIKTDGNWTSKLRDLVKGEKSQDIRIGINGPFGAPAQRFYDFSHTVLVGAGIGVTPFSGILADLQARDDAEHGGPERNPEREDSDEDLRLDRRASRKLSRTFSRTLTRVRSIGQREFAPDYRRVDFHWMVRDRNHLLWFSDLLNRISRSQKYHHDRTTPEAPHPHLDINLHTHVTQKRKRISTHVFRWLLESHRTEDHPESPLTGLLNATHYGRPDFVDILDGHYYDMVKFAKDQGLERLKIGVFFCGTPIVGEVLADRCRLLTARGEHEGTGIEYHFMIEVFG